MKLLINRQPKRTPWGGGSHFVTLFSDYMSKMGHTVVHEFSYGINAILMIDPRPEDAINDVNRILAYRMLNPKVKIVHRINDSDIPRGTAFLDQLNIESNKSVADHTVFISRWLQQYYVSKGFDADRPSTVITNGCDLSTFSPSNRSPIQDRKLKIVTHHWSDNFNKGFDAYISIDKYLEEFDDIEFTYVGRYFKDYKPQKTRMIAPLYGKDLAAELSKHDVYLTGARYEACGMHHIEGAACGMPVIYHDDGGGVVEMCMRYGARYNTIESLVDAIKYVRQNYVEYQEKLAQHRPSLSSELMCSEYRKIFESLL